MPEKLSVCIVMAVGSNIGDNAILVSMIDKLRTLLLKQNVNIDFTVFTPQPKEAHNYIRKFADRNTRFVGITNLFRVLASLSKCKICLFGGGGLITDDFNYRNIVMLLPLVLSILIKRRAMVFSLGVNKPSTWIGQKIVRILFNYVDALSVRDRDSYKNLRALGINKKIILSADPSLLLKPVGREAILGILKNEGIEITQHNRIIGVNLRHVYKYGKKNYRKLNIVEWAKILDGIIKKLDATLIFIPFDRNENKWFTNDLDVAYKLERCIKMKNRFKIIRGVYSPSEILGMMSIFDVFIGMRLHSLIFSAIVGVPFIGIVYDNKVKAFMSEIEMLDYAIPFEDVSFERLYSKITELLMNRNKIVAKIKKNISYLQRRSVLSFKCLLDIIS